VERLQILQLKAARCWSQAQVTRRLLLAPSTVAEWLARVDEGGEQALLRVPVPVNRFPDFVEHLVQQLAALVPSMGKVRIAQVLARAGLHLSASTVARLRKRKAPRPSQPTAPVPQKTTASWAAGGAVAPPTPKRVVTAKAPNHTWHVDFTVVPTAFGSWVPWWPFSLPNLWPFAWHLGVVLDHFSRKVMATAAFWKEPSTDELLALLDSAVAGAGKAPKYIISDQGTQFGDEYRAWCARHGVRPRFGAIGKKGSIAVVERFIRSLKDEALRTVIVPLGFAAMRVEVDAYVAWYNCHRPHRALAGRTPLEVYEGLAPARDGPRFEPRRRFPLRRRPKRHAPAAVRGRRGVVLELIVTHSEDRLHLPIVELRKAA
jgi:transposase InsO family protein